MNDNIFLQLVTDDNGYQYKGDDVVKKNVAAVVNSMEKVLSDKKFFADLPANDVVTPFMIMTAMWMNVLGGVIDENWESYKSKKEKESA